MNIWSNPPFSNRPLSLKGIPVECAPQVLSSTRKVFVLRLFNGAEKLVCWSMPVLHILMAPATSGVTFAAWHDDAFNCSTWTDAAGCRCEVDL